MGLDITSISQIEKSKTEEDGFYVHKGHITTSRHSLKEGWYIMSDNSREHHFRAGSYGSHNQFRRMLAEAIHGVKVEEIWMNEDQYDGTPFNELINFSDCEGTIGHKESKKLYEDFVLHQKIFARHVASTCKDSFLIQEWMEVYEDWTKACMVASEEGVILFQ